MSVKPISLLSRNVGHHSTARQKNSSALLQNSCFRGVMSSSHFRWSSQNSRLFRHSLTVLASSGEDDNSGVEEPQLARNGLEDKDDAIVPPSEAERAKAVSTSGGMCTSPPITEGIPCTSHIDVHDSCRWPVVQDRHPPQLVPQLLSLHQNKHSSYQRLYTHSCSNICACIQYMANSKLGAAHLQAKPGSHI